MILFQKEYDGESIIDVPEDVGEAFMEEYNPTASRIPQDEYGFQQGKFTVTIEWEGDAT